MTPFVRCCVYVTDNADKVFFLRCDCFLTLFAYLFVWGYFYCVHFAKTTYHIILELKLTTLLKSSWRVKRENFYKTFLFLNKKAIAFINQDGTLTVSLLLKKIQENKNHTRHISFIFYIKKRIMLSVVH